jgi:hypothetical protein
VSYISEAISQIIKYTFGENSKILSFDIIKDGRLNMALRVQCKRTRSL